MAPELVNHDATPASDMFSLGRTIQIVMAEIPGTADDSEIADVVAKLTCDDPAARPSAEAVQNHPYFLGAWNWVRTEHRTCCVCMEEFKLSEGLSCTNLGDGGTHFTCSECLAGHVSTESTADLRSITKRGGRVMCPYHAAGCTSGAFSDGALAAQIRSHPEIFQRYMTARQQLLEAQAAEQADERVHIELERLLALDEQERKVHQARLHVTENILNCSCPRCGQVFVDFTNCFALKCARCPCAFCAWCLEDCGDDAHDHVANCPHNTTQAQRINVDGDGVDLPRHYGSEEQFQVAQAVRRQRQLRQYLDLLDDNTRRAVLRALETELRNVGLDGAFKAL